ncbi:MAG: aldehyde dehydrogenase [Bdellovibrionales bacterium CG12_big_fil_rev_8_21_14_0_65_38_15]|nr:MAG: aldehyde dehydrogenase [Bdellovibrionales bacterium CG22_combo_CG10-13_8_21_14_all_38_13]PIQ54288.1 MAG: aldehyde dehydrogenase [Bdellovibrionales bacterium CG12_big_fil_rev_8_21_14_0_65_38_15]PIR29411.1 MAG: aldehyde dehydrogenase [Bdellovibrionales bacterium CG11_big_fil_rev_8_21_14_0_20_38_13]
MTENVKLTPSQISKFSKDASKQIRELTIEQRLKYVTALKKLILREKEIIIERIQDDTKKSKSDALVSEIFGVLDHLSFLEKETKKALADEKIKTPIALLGKKSRIYYEPLGTILIISPWNYPFYQAIVPIMAAFVSGNASIYKPSEFTPLTGLVEDLMKRIGMNQHWVQVVYGDGQIGSQLIDQRPDKIFFTGSVATGKKIMQQAASQLIPVELELGGKDPSIVFADANIKRAASGVVWGALTNCGQSCTSVERVYVQDTCVDEFTAEVKSIVDEIKQSRDYDGDSDFGGMTTSNQVAIVKNHLDDAISKGATLLCGHQWDGKNEMIPALVLTNVTEEMLIAHEETFGPIIPIMGFNDENEVISRANNSPYGLSASVWSHDLKRCDRVARALEVGNVSINNVMLTEGNHYLPFGGQKNSGIGRYKGVHGLRSFCNMKSILIDSDSKKIEANWFPYSKKKYQLFSKMTDGAFSGGLINFLKFAIFGTLTEGLSQKRRSQLK